MWNKDDIKNIDSSLSDAISDIDLNNVMVQYFWPKTNITSTFNGTGILNNTLQSPVFEKDVEGLLRDLYSRREIDGYDFDNTVFNFMLQSGTVLGDPDSDTSTRKITEETQAIQEQKGQEFTMIGIHI